MDNQVSISIKLCNRTYRIKVAATNEAVVRKTAQEINDKLASLKKDFPGRDEQDYLAMSLIDHITSAQAQPINNASSDSEILTKLQAIQNLLDE